MTRGITFRTKSLVASRQLKSFWNIVKSRVRGTNLPAGRQGRGAKLDDNCDFGLKRFFEKLAEAERYVKRKFAVEAFVEKIKLGSRVPLEAFLKTFRMNKGDLLVSSPVNDKHRNGKSPRGVFRRGVGY